jgi:hypothetical protein
LVAETTHLISSHYFFAEPSFPAATATNLCFMSQTNKGKPLTIIILVLVVVAREPIEWLTVLIVRKRNNTSHLISSHFSCAEPSFPAATATNLCFVSQTNKGKPLASIIFVLVVVAREPIEWLTVLIVSSRNNTSHLISFFLRRTFFSCSNTN